MRRTTIFLLCIMGGVLFAAWFFSTYEKVITERAAAYQGEARINDYLAAEMLLNGLQIEADSRSSLSPSQWLPEVTDTLFVRLSAAFSVAEERELLSAWVTDGGHLVLLPPEQKTRLTDDFLDYLGFRFVATGKDDDIEDGKQDEEPDDDTSESFVYLVDLEQTRVRIEMTEESVTDATLSDEQGFIAVRREWNAGYVTVVADSLYFENRFIGNSDHARLLLDVVAGYIPSGKVWFIYDSTFPPLWQLIWKHAPHIVIGLAMMLVIWLWSIVPAFGPKIRPGPPVRRSIVEHISAAGHFAWRHEGTAILVASTTAAVLHKAEARHPGISRLPVQKQAALIAGMSGQSVQAVMDMLQNRTEPRQREFTHDMQFLQTIRNEL